MSPKERDYELTEEFRQEFPDEAEYMLSVYASIYRRHRPQIILFIVGFVLGTIPASLLLMLRDSPFMGTAGLLASLWGIRMCIPLLNPSAYNLQRTRAR